MKPPLVSVIIPVYNAADTLRRAVDSVMQQTFRDFELILVDDGSRDAGGVMCDNFAARWPDQIRVLHKENGGLISAWTSGVGISRGRYLCFVDSDDWIDPEMLEKLSGQLKHGRAASQDASPVCLPGQIICCGYLIEYGNGRTRAVTHGLPEGIYEGERLEKELKQELLGHEMRRVIPSRCMKLIDRPLIEQNIRLLNPEIHMAEDLSITTPVLLSASRVVLMNDPLYHYAFVQGSMVHSYNPHLYDQYQLLRNQLRNVLAEKGIPSDVSEQEIRVRREYYFLFLNILKNEIRRKDGPNATGKAIRRIRELCLAEDSRALSASCQDRLTDRSYRLLALICRKPSPLRILLIRWIFLLYERLR